MKKKELNDKLIKTGFELTYSICDLLREWHTPLSESGFVKILNILYLELAQLIFLIDKETHSQFCFYAPPELENPQHGLMAIAKVLTKIEGKPKLSMITPHALVQTLAKLDQQIVEFEKGGLTAICEKEYWDNFKKPA